MMVNTFIILLGWNTFFLFLNPNINGSICFFPLLLYLFVQDFNYLSSGTFNCLRNTVPSMKCKRCNNTPLFNTGFAVVTKYCFLLGDVQFFMCSHQANKAKSISLWTNCKSHPSKIKLFLKQIQRGKSNLQHYRILSSSYLTLDSSWATV